MIVSSETARETARRAFLAEAGYGDARREPLAGDASTRAYERLYLPDGARAILMDAPPTAESAPSIAASAANSCSATLLAARDPGVSEPTNFHAGKDRVRELLSPMMRMPR